MNRSALHSLLTMLFVASGLPTIVAAQTVVVSVDNDARIPAADLGEMEQAVARSYRAIGVQMIWEHGQEDPRGPRVHLRLLSQARAGG